MVSTIADKIEALPLRFGRKHQNYSENACLIAMSDYSGRFNFVNCSVKPNVMTRSMFCRDWKLCPFCAHVRRKELIRKYLRSYSKGQWFFLTISFNAAIPVANELIYRIGDYYEACRYGVDTLLWEGVFSGAFMVEGFAVGSFLPEPYVLPHYHVLVKADNITRESLQRLTEVVNSFSGQKKVPVDALKFHKGRVIDRKLRWVNPEEGEERFLGTEANTRTYRLTQHIDFVNVLGYMSKPVDFYPRYKEAVDTISGDGSSLDNPIAMSRLNENFECVIEAWREEVRPRTSHRYGGDLMHRSSGFIGTRKDDREKYTHRLDVDVFLLEEQARQCGWNAPDFPGSLTPIEFEDGDEG